jgi:hypothetical protein
MFNNFRQANPELSKIAVFKKTQFIAAVSSLEKMFSHSGMLDDHVTTLGSGEVILSYKTEMVLAQLGDVEKLRCFIFFLRIRVFCFYPSIKWGGK